MIKEINFTVKPVKVTTYLTKKELMSKKVYRTMVNRVAEALVSNCVIRDTGILSSIDSEMYTFSIYCLAGHKDTDPNRLPD